jgi:hypothetical protein
MLRRSFTWVVPAAVVAVGVFAGFDALRSSNGEPSTASAPSATENEASPTATTATTANEASLSAWQEIERAGNDWARLFSAGDRIVAISDACKYMTQPGCLRIACGRAGYRPIENCTPPSWAFQKSFADATVVAIVIKGQQANARFSNGKTVRLEIGVGGSWWIDRVGAGRQFFE